MSCLDRHRGDACVPPRWLSPILHDDPLYEFALVSGLRSSVESGDTVVVVGGGLGITAALAGQLAGGRGSVLCYEGTSASVADIRETARRNEVADRVTVMHGIVGTNVSVYGPTRGCTTVKPEDLPACDVLQLDCEGAEHLILRAMRIRPRVILVETHGMLGSTSAACAALLEKIGYRVTHLGVAEPALHEFCAENDIVVLLGRRADDDTA